MNANTKVTSLVVASALVLGVASFATNSDEKNILGVNASLASENEPGTIQEFSSGSFIRIYDGLPLPNTTPIVEPPEITQSKSLDAHIISIAEERGYTLRSVPASDLQESADDQVQLQELAKIALQEMLQAASDEGQTLYANFGYRSVDEQRDLFLQRLYAQGHTNAQLSSGEYDAHIHGVLALASPPGYSKHHSGYTIDLADNRSSFFDESEAYAWLSANNFEKAKSYGFAPSYPEGISNQGPDPEEWEFVWVGIENLSE